MRAEVRCNRHATDGLYTELVLIPEGEAEEIILAQIELASLAHKIQAQFDGDENCPEFIISMCGMDRA